jgi:hypothetical protein
MTTGKWNTYYFAADGSYGCTNGLSVTDTSHWTDEDWQRIDEASDGDRADVAREIIAIERNAEKAYQLWKELFG